MRISAGVQTCALPISVDQAVVSTKLPRLDIVPATQDLSGAEVELVDVDQRMHRLDGALNAIPAGRYDVVLTDCPPSPGLLTVNALVAAHSKIGRASGRERVCRYG